MAMLLVSVAALAPAQAYIADTGYVWMTSDGGEDLSATDWRFYVSVPSTLSTDAAYWNFTVYGQLVNSTGLAAEGTWSVVIYVDDGVLNRSVTAPVALSLAGKVYANVSFTEAVIELFDENSAASMYVTLANTTSVVKDAYHHDIGIYRTVASASTNTMVVAMVGAMMTVVMLVIVFKLIVPLMNLPGLGKKK